MFSDISEIIVGDATEKFPELQGRRVKFLSDVGLSFMLMVSAVLYYVLAAHAVRSSHETAVCLSVRP